MMKFLWKIVSNLLLIILVPTIGCAVSYEEASNWYDKGEYYRLLENIPLNLTGDTDLLLLRAYAAEHLDQAEQGERTYQRLLLLEPQNPLVLREFGIFLVDRDREYSVGLLRRSLMFNPTDSLTQYFLASALKQEGEETEALALFASSLEDEEMQELSAINIAEIYRGWGRVSDAVQVLRTYRFHPLVADELARTEETLGQTPPDPTIKRLEFVSRVRAGLDDNVDFFPTTPLLTTPSDIRDQFAEWTLDGAYSAVLRDEFSVDLELFTSATLFGERTEFNQWVIEPGLAFTWYPGEKVEWGINPVFTVITQGGDEYEKSIGNELFLEWFPFERYSGRYSIEMRRDRFAQQPPFDARELVLEAEQDFVLSEKFAELALIYTYRDNRARIKENSYRGYELTSELTVFAGRFTLQFVHQYRNLDYRRFFPGLATNRRDDQVIAEALLRFELGNSVGVEARYSNTNAGSTLIPFNFEQELYSVGFVYAY